ncbi:hypothetical protein [Streptomyces phaeochromogenes]|uniref:hypothetical protein n=1 Tax=Streptomyces phaeochromogenes TaxID=1923 RepID=UPI0035943A9A
MLVGRRPEHIAPDGHGRLLTGVEDGRVLRVDPAPPHSVDQVAHTGAVRSDRPRRPTAASSSGTRSGVCCGCLPKGSARCWPTESAESRYRCAATWR